MQMVFISFKGQGNKLFLVRCTALKDIEYMASLSKVQRILSALALS